MIFSSKNICVFGLILGIVQASIAAADDQAQPSDSQERIEVTGSHIKRIDTEGVAPVQTITHQELEKKGYNNLGDVVRDMGSNSFGSSNSTPGNSTTPGYQDVSLRGLGSDNTLVLLNGQRLPPDAQQGTVDINLIPMAAVERIEVLKDGASAVYGSDALGGVVNIITRKDFEGTELTATQTFPGLHTIGYPGGKQTNLSAVNGINGEQFNIVTAINYRYNQAINSSDRPWSAGASNTQGNPGSYLLLDSSGNPVGSFRADTHCPSYLLYTDSSGTYCRFRYSDYSQEAPQISQIGGLSELHYNASSDVKFTARVVATHRDAQTIAAPSPGSALTVPANIASTWGLPGYISGDSLAIYYRTTQLGPRMTDVQTDSYNGLVGTTIQLPRDWALDIDSTYNLIQGNLQGTSGYARQDLMQNLINNGNVNLFAQRGYQGDLSSASYQPFEITQSKLLSLEAKVSGDLAETAAGPIGLALGTLINYTSYSDQADTQTLNGNVLGNAGGSGAGHRTAEAAYAELSIPLIKKTLELQAAGRFDHYSDFGSTVNPKIGFLLHPSSDFLVRGSWGTGFRAPLLTELYAGQSTGDQTFIDHVSCNGGNKSDCVAQQHQVTGGSNPGLKQETSNSYTLGGAWEPTPDAHVGTDWYLTTISNIPGINYEDMTKAEAAGYGTTTCSGGYCTWTDPAAGNQFSLVRQGTPTGVITNVNAPLLNLSQESVAGVDITGSYRYNKLKLSTEQNQMFFYKIEGFPGSGYTNKLGWNQQPSWRNTSSLAYIHDDKHSATLTSLSIPSQYNAARTGNISPITTFDLSLMYKTKESGNFTVAVINIVNSSPPLDPTSPTSPVNYSLYDPNGRQLVLGYNKKF